MRTVTVRRRKKVRRFRVPAAANWKAVASYVASLLDAGDIIALTGQLGAGKTTFVQALAKELGIRRLPQSPTFALMRRYAVPATSSFSKKISSLIHVDAYRIEDERDLVALDLEHELADGQSVLVVEWAERIRGWLSGRASVMRLDIK